VLQSLVEGFGDLHGVNLLPRSSGPTALTLFNLIDATA
jgi:hypothetical protein